MRVVFTLTGLLVLGLFCLSDAAPPAAEPALRKYALLVGCSRYANLPSSMQLEGPANDVLLLRELLISRFQFASEDILILSEAAAKEAGAEKERRLPTRANIEREFRNLAERVKPGDKVVISISGHGSRQPDSKPDDPNRFKPDGLEEIFLPADVSQGDANGRLNNAIVDYEFRDWLAKIREKKASVWMIVDCCHSASMIRGTEDEVVREVPTEKLVPEAVLRKVRERDRDRIKARSPNDRTQAKRGPIFKLPPDEPDIVALYAAQSIEPTIERLMPVDSKNAKPYGLLTYTLCQVLTEAKTPLTYTELVQRIHDRYIGWGRTYPTPLLEGKDRNQEVLGDKSHRDRSRIRLFRKDTEWEIDAGSLHGMTAGSILEVRPPAGSGEDVKGCIRITRDGLDVLRAKVEPCEYKGLPARTELPDRGRCQLVFLDYGDLRIRVGVDQKTGEGELLPDLEQSRLQKELTKLTEDENSLIEFAASAKNAQWLLRLDSLKSRRLFLVPASGMPLPETAEQTVGSSEDERLRLNETRRVDRLPAQLGPVPTGSELGQWLKTRLSRIATAQNLLNIAIRSRDAPEREEGEEESVKLEAVLLDSVDDQQGKSISPGDGKIVVYDGDRIGIRLTNQGREAWDVTLLYIDSNYEIQSLFPMYVTTDNRLRAKQPLHLGYEITDDTIGLEHMILIAQKAKSVDQYANFCWLAQRSLLEARQELTTRNRGTTDLESALGKLLLKARFGAGEKRGSWEVDNMSDFVVRQLSWYVLSNKRLAEKRP